MIETVSTKPYRRPEARHLRPAQEGAGLPAGELCRELHPVDLRLGSRGFAGKTLVIGGDGRYFNREVIQIAIRMAAANGFGSVMVGQGGILSTPAASQHHPQVQGLRRHHPVGQPQSRRPERGFRHQVQHRQWRPGTRKASPMRSSPAPRRSPNTGSPTHPTSTSTRSARFETAGMTVEVIDPVADYADADGGTVRFRRHPRADRPRLPLAFDAMSAVTGPYAKEILEKRLGAPRASVRQLHAARRISAATTPTRTLSTPRMLYDTMMAADAPDFGAASDGDGDRNLIIGKGIFVTPSDWLAMLAANAHLAPGYSDGLTGIARSMPTSARRGPGRREARHRHVRDSDRLEVLRQPARRRNGDHLRRGERRHRLGPCAREGRAVGGAPLAQHSCQARRERRGNRRASTGREYGRNYYSRHDYEGVETEAANELMAGSARPAIEPPRQAVRRSGGGDRRRLRLP